jgi:hypothetical protein
MMTLANMRENGVRSLAVRCMRCHHETTLDVDGYADDVVVPSFGSRIVCTACGARSMPTRDRTGMSGRRFACSGDRRCR